MPKIPTAVALGLLVLFVAISIPAAIDTGTSDSELVTELNRSETETVTQSLQVTLDDATDTDATVTLMDTMTSESQTQTIPVDGSETYTIDNETITVQVIEASNAAKEATLSIHYPRTYGWDDGTGAIVDNMPLIFTLVGFVIIVGSAGAMLK